MKDAAIAKNKFWQHGEQIVVSEQLLLRPVKDSDREGFLDLQRQYSPFKKSLEIKRNCDLVWNEHSMCEAITLSIEFEEQYIGYCSVNPTSKTPWEISIELRPERTKQGIGRLAISAMLDAVKTRLGVDVFRIRIEPTNTASQKLFEKLGAVSHGISEVWVHDQKILEEVEEKNLHLIDDQLTSVADKFGVEPRKLLSHVLEYSLVWQTDDEKIDAVARDVLDRFRPAFEELAKGPGGKHEDN